MDALAHGLSRVSPQQEEIHRSDRPKAISATGPPIELMPATRPMTGAQTSHATDTIIEMSSSMRCFSVRPLAPGPVPERTVSTTAALGVSPIVGGRPRAIHSHRLQSSRAPFLMARDAPPITAGVDGADGHSRIRGVTQRANRECQGFGIDDGLNDTTGRGICSHRHDGTAGLPSPAVPNGTHNTAASCDND